VALFGATIYLLNFDVPNLRVAGLIDAGEGGLQHRRSASQLVGGSAFLRTRALFNVAGPILSLSAAIFLAGPTRAAERRGRGGTRGPEEHTSC